MSNSKLPIKYGLPERLVVGLLGKLTKGHLKLTYADGSSRHFGNPAEPVRNLRRDRKFIAAFCPGTAEVQYNMEN